jgi:hypothetical protein
LPRPHRIRFLSLPFPHRSALPGASPDRIPRRLPAVSSARPGQPVYLQVSVLYRYEGKRIDTSEILAGLNHHRNDNVL